MKNLMILLVLISIGLTTPVLADGRHGEERYNSNHRRVEQSSHNYARHDRSEKYDRFQKRMKHLRKDLRHENRRLERRDVRRSQRIADRRHAGRVHRSYRPWYRSAPVVVAPRHRAHAVFFPSITVRIPLNW